MEPLLLLCVGGDFFGSITSKSVELTTKLVNRPSALGEVVELLTLAVHKTLGNVVLMKNITKLIPRCHWTSWAHVHEILPPIASCTLKVVGGIVDSVTICNMSIMKL